MFPMGTQSDSEFTVGKLAVRWRLTEASVRSIVGEFNVTLDREGVLAFEQTPRGRQIVVRAIRIESDEIERGFVLAAGVKPRHDEEVDA